MVGVPSDYLVSTQLQLWLFCCWAVGLFLGLGKGSDIVLGSTHVVEQLSFSMLP